MDQRRSDSGKVAAYPSDEASAARLRAWRLSLAITGIGIAVILSLLWETAASAVDLWWRDSAYGHAFLIFPISAYLIWLKRHVVIEETPNGSFWGVAVTCFFGFLWLASDLAEINEGRHLAFIGIFLGVILSGLGRRIFAILAFPLLYLWLTVPTGSFLVPGLQVIATDISTRLIHLVGIPVYSEGLNIEVPTGLYNVAPGCAGLNFILATLAIAPLYAYWFYRPAWKRFLAVGIALLLSVVMNWVRIAGIIAVAHWSDRQLNIVDDHLLYGWGFFLLVLFAAGYIGMFFADDEADATMKTRASSQPIVGPGALANWTLLTGTLSVVIVAAMFTYSEMVKASAPVQSMATLQGAFDIRGWRSRSWSADWSPRYPGAYSEMRRSYVRNGKKVDLYVAYYARQGPGRELIAHDNQIVDRARWRILKRSWQSMDTASGAVPISALELISANSKRHIWYFYWVGGSMTARSIGAKLYEAKSKLLFGDQRAALIAVSTSADDDNASAAENVLRSFLKALPPTTTLLKSAPSFDPATSQQKPR